MGVESYFPRFQLEAAPAIAWCEELAVEYSDVNVVAEALVNPESSVVIETVSDQGLVSSQYAEQPKSGLANKIFESPKARVDTTVIDSTKQLVAEVSKRTATVVIPRFQHRIVSGGLLVLIDTGAADNEQHRRLLRNLSLSVRSSGGANIQEDQFIWPESTLPKGALANTEAATEAFTHCVLGKAARSGAKLCILFGETAFLAESELVGELPLIQGGSLESLLTNPLVKRDLWNRIHTVLEAQGAKTEG